MSSRERTPCTKLTELSEWLNIQLTSTTASKLMCSEWVMLTTRKCMDFKKDMVDHTIMDTVTATASCIMMLVELSVATGMSMAVRMFSLMVSIDSRMVSVAHSFDMSLEAVVLVG
uniref:Uncharacterized protein n=1 Tax=Anopheles melas TaxID=34690 RepID=A0A182TVA6_9DIPT